MQSISTFNQTAYADLVDYAVVDQTGDSVGSIHSLWCDADSGQLEFLGVKTGWLFGSNHVVPTENVQIDEASRTVKVPYALDLIKNAPAIAADAEITDAEEAEIYRYYSLRRDAAATATRTTATGTDHLAAGTAAAMRDTAAAGDAVDVTLREEQLKVGKRSVDAGAVRLRKVIRTEVVNTPVELRREDVVVERIPASEVRPGDIAAADFNEKNIDITLHREEAVIVKETVVTGGVRLRKTAETETQTVSDSVRKEDVIVDKSGVTNTEVHRDATTQDRR